MKTTTDKQSAQMNKGRYSDLKLMLEDRRREILNEVQGKIRDQRDEHTWGKVNEVLDAGESSEVDIQEEDRKSTRLNSSHVEISYAVFCLKKKKNIHNNQ